MSNKNVYCFTVSRLGNSLPKEGEIYAADESCLGDGEVIARFSRVDTLDEDGCCDEQYWVNASGKLKAEDPEEVIGELDIKKKLRPYELNGVLSTLWVDSDGSYDLAEDKWVMSLDGRINIEDNEIERLKKSLAVSVQPYYYASIKLDPKEPYGLKIKGEPSDEHNFSGVILSPSEKMLKKLIQDAGNESDELLSIVKEWSAPDILQIQEAFKRAKEHIGESTYVPTYRSLIYASLNIFKNEKEALQICSDFEKRIANGDFDKNYGRCSAYDNLGNTFICDEFKTIDGRKEARRCLDLAVPFAMTKEEVENLINLAGGSGNLSNADLAQSVLDKIVENTSDTKLKAKLKKVGKEAIDNLC